MERAGRGGHGSVSRLLGRRGERRGHIPSRGLPSSPPSGATRAVHGVPLPPTSDIFLGPVVEAEERLAEVVALEAVGVGVQVAGEPARARATASIAASRTCERVHAVDLAGVQPVRAGAVDRRAGRRRRREGRPRSRCPRRRRPPGAARGRRGSCTRAAAPVNMERPAPSGSGSVRSTVDDPRTLSWELTEPAVPC
jgi:hypothetical protein